MLAVLKSLLCLQPTHYEYKFIVEKLITQQKSSKYKVKKYLSLILVTY